NEERFLLGTQHSPKCFYITRDSKFYYCANDHVNWQKWDLSTGKLIDTRQGRQDNTEMIGDEHLVTVNDEHTIMAVQDYENYSFYDLWNGKLLQKVQFTEKEKEARITFTAAAFSPQGNVWVTSSVNLHDDESDHRPHVRFIDTKSGRTIMETAGFSGSVSGIFLAPDDKSIAITGEQQPVRVWAMDKTGGRMVSLSNGTINTDNLYWSPDSRVVVSGGLQGNFMTDLNTGDHQGASTHFIYSMSGNGMGDNFCISPDFKLVCGEQQVMNYEDGNSVCVANSREDYYHKGSDPNASSEGSLFERKTFLQDNRTVVLVNGDGKQVNVNILDIIDCKKEGIISFDCGSVISHEEELKYAVGGGGKYIALGVNSVRVYNISTQDMVMEIPHRGPDKEDPFVSAVAINPQENLLAVSYLDTTVIIYEIPSGKKLQTIRGHDLPVTSLVFRSKNNMLITASPDSKIIFWDPSTGEQLGTLAAVDSTDFIITTPDNYYFATRGALKKVAFRKGKRTFPFEQFDLKFNRPDIVFKKLDLASNAQIKMYYLAYQKRLQKAGFTEEMLSNDIYLPEAEVMNKYSLPILKYDDTLSFTVNAKDEKYSLNRINVYVNDVSIYGAKGFSLADRPKEKSQRINLKLSPGINRIQVSVTNDKGMESMRDEFEVSCQLPDRKPDLYLLVVGVSQFKDAQHNLKYAAKDAQDLVSAFANDQQFGHVIVKQVLNTDATKENILKEGNMFANAKVDDVVMLYVSSHGLLDEKLDYYIATTDVAFSNPSERGLPYQELENMMEKSPSRNRLVLIDACHSGEVDKEETEIVQNKNVSDNKNVQVV
ncbi:MAG TPA: caspase family protein, partial [Bacteroidia bacterium]